MDMTGTEAGGGWITVEEEVGNMLKALCFNGNGLTIGIFAGGGGAGDGGGGVGARSAVAIFLNFLCKYLPSVSSHLCSTGSAKGTFGSSEAFCADEGGGVGGVDVVVDEVDDDALRLVPVLLLILAVLLDRDGLAGGGGGLSSDNAEFCRVDRPAKTELNWFYFICIAFNFLLSCTIIEETTFDKSG